MKLVNIGFGNLVNFDRVVAVVSPDSSPIKRLIGELKEKSSLIDATHGRKTKSVIITDCGTVILSYLPPMNICDKTAEDDENGQQ